MLEFHLRLLHVLRDVESKVGLVYARLLQLTHKRVAWCDHIDGFLHQQSLQEEMLQVRAPRDLVVLTCERVGNAPQAIILGHQRACRLADLAHLVGDRPQVPSSSMESYIAIHAHHDQALACVDEVGYRLLQGVNDRQDAMLELAQVKEAKQEERCTMDEKSKEAEYWRLTAKGVYDEYLGDVKRRQGDVPWDAVHRTLKL